MVNTVEINGVDIAFFDQGPRDGVPVILSHSLFFDHTMFDELGQHYLSGGYRVISYDHPGQGASGDATADQLSVDGLASVAAGLITHLGVGPVHFVGNSLGGMVALRLVARRPELLRSAVAAGASAAAEDSAKLVEYAPLAAALTANGGAELAEPILYIMFGDDAINDAGNTAVAQWRKHIAALPPRIGPATRGVIYRGDVRPELEHEIGIRRVEGARLVPVLAVAGAQDHAYPPPISSDDIAAAAAGRAVTIAGAGHSPTLEQPEAVAAETLRHFVAADSLVV